MDAAVIAPTYETTKFGTMPLLDVSASYDEANKTSAVFIVNRSQTESLKVELHWQDRAPSSIAAVHQMGGSDPKAANTFANPNNIIPTSVAVPVIKDKRAEMVVPPLSFTAIDARL